MRSKVAGRWGQWVVLPTLDDHPDPTDAEDTAVRGTHLRWVGAAEGVQVQVAGEPPRGADPRAPAPRAAARATRTRSPTRWSPAAPPPPAQGEPVPRPTIRSRKDWGATESWRDGSPALQPHHRAAARAPHRQRQRLLARPTCRRCIRGFYRYHTQNLGWCDIAYNFLVDKYGRHLGGPGRWRGQAGARRAHPRLQRHLDRRRGDRQLRGRRRRRTRCWARWPRSRPGSSTSTAAGPRGKITVRSEGSDKYAAGTWSRCASSTVTATPTTPPAPASCSTPACPTCAPRPTGSSSSYRNGHAEGARHPRPEVTGRTPARASRSRSTREPTSPAGAKVTCSGAATARPSPGPPAGATAAPRPTSAARSACWCARPARAPSAAQDVVAAGRVTTPVKVVAAARSRRGKVRVAASTWCRPGALAVTPTGRVSIKVGSRTKTGHAARRQGAHLAGRPQAHPGGPPPRRGHLHRRPRLQPEPGRAEGAGRRTHLIVSAWARLVVLPTCRFP